MKNKNKNIKSFSVVGVLFLSTMAVISAIYYENNQIKQEEDTLTQQDNSVNSNGIVNTKIYAQVLGNTFANLTYRIYFDVSENPSVNLNTIRNEIKTIKLYPINSDKKIIESDPIIYSHGDSKDKNIYNSFSLENNLVEESRILNISDGEENKIINDAQVSIPYIEFNVSFSDYSYDGYVLDIETKDETYWIGNSNSKLISEKNNEVIGWLNSEEEHIPYPKAYDFTPYDSTVNLFSNAFIEDYERNIISFKLVGEINNSFISELRLVDKYNKTLFLVDKNNIEYDDSSKKFKVDLPDNISLSVEEDYRIELEIADSYLGNKKEDYIDNFTYRTFSMDIQKSNFKSFNYEDISITNIVTDYNYLEFDLHFNTSKNSTIKSIEIKDIDGSSIKNGNWVADNISNHNIYNNEGINIEMINNETYKISGRGLDMPSRYQVIVTYESDVNGSLDSYIYTPSELVNSEFNNKDINYKINENSTNISESKIALEGNNPNSWIKKANVYNAEDNTLVDSVYANNILDTNNGISNKNEDGFIYLNFDDIFKYDTYDYYLEIYYASDYIHSQEEYLFSSKIINHNLFKKELTISKWYHYSNWRDLIEYINIEELEYNWVSLHIQGISSAYVSYRRFEIEKGNGDDLSPYNSPNYPSRGTGSRWKLDDQNILNQNGTELSNSSSNMYLFYENNGLDIEIYGMANSNADLGNFDLSITEGNYNEWYNSVSISSTDEFTSNDYSKTNGTWNIGDFIPSSNNLSFTFNSMDVQNGTMVIDWEGNRNDGFIKSATLKDGGSQVKKIDITYDPNYEANSSISYDDSAKQVTIDFSTDLTNYNNLNLEFQWANDFNYGSGTNLNTQSYSTTKKTVAALFKTANDSDFPITVQDNGYNYVNFDIGFNPSKDSEITNIEILYNDNQVITTNGADLQWTKSDPDSDMTITKQSNKWNIQTPLPLDNKWYDVRISYTTNSVGATTNKYFGSGQNNYALNTVPFSNNSNFANQTYTINESQNRIEISYPESMQNDNSTMSKVELYDYNDNKVDTVNESDINESANNNKIYIPMNFDLSSANDYGYDLKIYYTNGWDNGVHTESSYTKVHVIPETFIYTDHSDFSVSNNTRSYNSFTFDISYNTLVSGRVQKIDVIHNDGSAVTTADFSWSVSDPNADFDVVDDGNGTIFITSDIIPETGRDYRLKFDYDTDSSGNTNTFDASGKVLTAITFQSADTSTPFELVSTDRDNKDISINIKDDLNDSFIQSARLVNAKTGEIAENIYVGQGIEINGTNVTLSFDDAIDLESDPWNIEVKYASSFNNSTQIYGSSKQIFANVFTEVFIPADEDTYNYQINEFNSKEGLTLTINTLKVTKAEIKGLTINGERYELDGTDSRVTIINQNGGQTVINIYDDSNRFATDTVIDEITIHVTTDLGGNATEDSFTTKISPVLINFIESDVNDYEADYTIDANGDINLEIRYKGEYTDATVEKLLINGLEYQFTASPDNTGSYVFNVTLDKDIIIGDSGLSLEDSFEYVDIIIINSNNKVDNRVSINLLSDPYVFLNSTSDNYDIVVNEFNLEDGLTLTIKTVGGVDSEIEGIFINGTKYTLNSPLVTVDPSSTKSLLIVNIKDDLLFDLYTEIDTIELSTTAYKNGRMTTQKVGNLIDNPILIDFIEADQISYNLEGYEINGSNATFTFTYVGSYTDATIEEVVINNKTYKNVVWSDSENKWTVTIPTSDVIGNSGLSFDDALTSVSIGITNSNTSTNLVFVNLLTTNYDFTNSVATDYDIVINNFNTNEGLTLTINFGTGFDSELKSIFINGEEYKLDFPQNGVTVTKENTYWVVQIDNKGQFDTNTTIDSVTIRTTAYIASAITTQDLDIIFLNPYLIDFQEADLNDYQVESISENGDVLDIRIVNISPHYTDATIEKVIVNGKEYDIDWPVGTVSAVISVPIIDIVGNSGLEPKDAINTINIIAINSNAKNDNSIEYTIYENDFVFENATNANFDTIINQFDSVAGLTVTVNIIESDSELVSVIILGEEYSLIPGQDSRINIIKNDGKQLVFNIVPSEFDVNNDVLTEISFKVTLYQGGQVTEGIITNALPNDMYMNFFDSNASDYSVNWVLDEKNNNIIFYVDFNGSYTDSEYLRIFVSTKDGLTFEKDITSSDLNQEGTGFEMTVPIDQLLNDPDSPANIGRDPRDYIESISIEVTNSNNKKDNTELFYLFNGDEEFVNATDSTYIITINEFDLNNGLVFTIDTIGNISSEILSVEINGEVYVIQQVGGAQTDDQRVTITKQTSNQLVVQIKDEENFDINTEIYKFTLTTTWSNQGVIQNNNIISINFENPILVNFVSVSQQDFIYILEDENGNLIQVRDDGSLIYVDYIDTNGDKQGDSYIDISSTKGSVDESVIITSIKVEYVGTQDKGIDYTDAEVISISINGNQYDFDNSGKITSTNSIWIKDLTEEGIVFTLNQYIPENENEEFRVINSISLVLINDNKPGSTESTFDVYKYVSDTKDNSNVLSVILISTGVMLFTVLTGLALFLIKGKSSKGNGGIENHFPSA